MTDAELDRIAEAATSLRINFTTGRYHKPVALIWAIDRAIRGLPRLVTASTVRRHLDPVLSDLGGAESNAAWPWLKLANDMGSAWVAGGADPSKDPPAEFVAGWSRSGYLAITADPGAGREVLERVLERYLGGVRDAVLAALTLDLGREPR